MDAVDLLMLDENPNATGGAGALGLEKVGRYGLEVELVELFKCEEIDELLCKEVKGSGASTAGGRGRGGDELS